HQWWGDLYVFPNGFYSVSLPDVTKGQTTPRMPLLENAPDGDWVQLTFHDFQVDRSALAGIDPNSGEMPPIEIGADVTVNMNGQQFPHRKVSMRIAEGKRLPGATVDLKTPGGAEYVLMMSEVHPDTGAASFNLFTRDVALFSALSVPGIQILWFGAYLL